MIANSGLLLGWLLTGAAPPVRTPQHVVHRPATARMLDESAADQETAAEQTLRAQAMIEAQDYAGAELEASRALGNLPDLANASAVRGRALLFPILEEMMEEQTESGSVSGFCRLDFKEAWDAFRLAQLMDPTNAEVAMELERLGELMKGLPVELTETTVETGTSPAAESATPVRGVEMDDVDEGEAADQPDAERDADVDVIIVGAGAAGIGCATSLIHTFGLAKSDVLILERGDAIGTSFRQWPAEMRFISPSFNQAGWTNSFDLNSVAHGSSPA